MPNYQKHLFEAVKKLGKEDLQKYEDYDEFRDDKYGTTPEENYKKFLNELSPKELEDFYFIFKE